MKERIFRFLKQGIILGLGSVLVGLLLLVLVFCLPVDAMREHVFQDVDTILMAPEEMPQSGVWNYIHTNRETFTDAIMVQNAIEKIDGENPYEHAIWVYHWDLGEEVVWKPEGTLHHLSDGGGTEDLYLRTYARYWHGYLVYLKPLLMLFSWKTVAVMNAVGLVLLLGVLVWTTFRKKCVGVAVITAAGMLFMKPLLIHASLDMAVCWWITLAALLFMVYKHKWLAEKEFYAEFFVLIGILTAYFDFLTYPIVTLGFPLCAYYILKKSATVKKLFGDLIGFCISWGLGYVGMWSMKWVVSDLTMQTGTIRDGVWAVIGRTEAIGNRTFGLRHVTNLNLQEYNLPIYGIMAILLFIACTVLVVLACRKVGVKKMLPWILLFAVVACIPFAWIMVVQYHSALHARFTFRIIAVTVVAVAALGVRAVQEWKASDENP